MKFKRTDYRIHDSELGSKDVTGYAVDQNYVRVRIAVRKIGRRLWACDHWDTGLRVCTGSTRVGVAMDGLRIINEKQRSGEYAFALARAKQHGCLSFDMSGATKP